MTNGRGKGGEGEKTDGRGEGKEGGGEDGKKGGTIEEKIDGRADVRGDRENEGMNEEKKGGRSEGGREGGIGDDTRPRVKKSTTHSHIITRGRHLLQSRFFSFFDSLLCPLSLHCFRSVFRCTRSPVIDIYQREGGREGGRERGSI